MIHMVHYLRDVVQDGRTRTISAAWGSQEFHVVRSDGNRPYCDCHGKDILVEISASQNEQGCHNDSLHELHPRPLHNITFTDSGKYLFGVCEEYGTDHHTYKLRKSVQPIRSSCYPKYTLFNDTSNEYSVLATDAVRSLIYARSPLDISLSWDGDAVESSTLHQHKDDSIVLSSLSMDGRERDTILLRIPKSISQKDVSSTLLDPLDDSPTMSLVLNKAVQRKYNTTKYKFTVLPIIIERQKKTVDIVTSNHYLRYSPDEDQPGTKRRRV